MGATATSASVAAPAAVHNILFATDFSPCSENALPFAVAMAKHYGAALFVTHIIPPEPRHELPLEPLRDAINPRKQEAQRHFDAMLASGVLKAVVHEPILRSGIFWDELQDVIASRSVDMIITGTHGRQGLRKLILGSVAEEIFRRAACPVITIGPGASSDLVTRGIRHILFATDFTLPSINALAYATSLAEKEGAQLTLMHVIQPAPLPVDVVVVPMYDSDQADAARQRLEGMVSKLPQLPSTPEVLVMNGTTAETIVHAAQERKAAMIVMGVRHKSAVGAHSPWSVADAVVCRAHCPVLTVRGD
jgi:nucleotide-binding universal stress UspA family protein